MHHRLNQPGPQHYQPQFPNHPPPPPPPQVPQDVPRLHQPVPAVTTSSFTPAIPSSSRRSSIQEPPIKTERNYIAGQAYPRTSPDDQMAVQTLSNRQAFPGMAGYHGSFSQPMHPDMQSRTTYYNYSVPQNMSYYPAYVQPQYSANMPAYPGHPSGMMMPSQMPSHSLTPSHSASATAPPPLTNLDSIPRMKTEPSPVDSQQGSLPRRPPQLGAEPVPKTEGSTAAAPGPIPATTPLVVKQDQSGVQWIAFEYSRDRVKQEYTIRCDVESIDTERLTDEFKSANCVYPRAYVQKGDYKGNRLQYETECNAVGWALAKLNPVLQEKRGLIQRAVDSWRNSNQDPKLRSRRVRRMNKVNNRRERQSSASATTVQMPMHSIQQTAMDYRHPSMSGPSSMPGMGLAHSGINTSPTSMGGMHFM
ncbi:hypothetical protein KVT40_006788 [Elsinoe batatas]|uniref:DUF8032 domain-containing protein n=1 Tax=Elsinoe batatas TaxID=2601811 RepID=A0A8K0PDY0_9PEZI|nr:hypothetical protein KVT40_006788 [Elsinoe batatas]